MRIQTVRFGEIEVQPAQVFEMVQPLIGFPDTSFALICDESTSPVQWLQSLATPQLCLPVADPLAIMPGFDVEIPPEECSALELERTQDALVLAIVVLDPEPTKIRVNLKAPIIFNVTNQKAIQAVINDPNLPVRYYIFGQTSDQLNQQPGKMARPLSGGQAPHTGRASNHSPVRPVRLPRGDC